MPKNFFKAVAVMVGYIIGVGMFSLPYLINKAGVLTFLIFIIFLGAVQHFQHLIYANLIIVTRRYHRLPGYVGIYLGKTGKKLVFVAKLVGNYGALLAYIIITGIFLHQLLSPYFGGSEFLYSTLLFACEALVVYLGVGMIARFELFMAGLLILVISLITIKGWPAVNMHNYLALDWRYFFIPYGAMLFSLDGNGSLPIVVKLLKKNKEGVKKAISVSAILSIIIITVFTLIIVGITGDATTEDSLVGLKMVLGNSVALLALIFGIISMMTSFFGVAEAVKETLWWDFKMDKKLAWALAVFVPYIFYLAGFKNLINVISFVGAVAGGFSAIMLILVFIKLKKKRNKLVLFKYQPSDAITYFLIMLFIFGIVYEIRTFIL